MRMYPSNVGNRFTENGSICVFSISSGCISTLTTIALSPSGDCLNIAGLVSLATLSSTSSIIPPIDSWLTGLCEETSPSKCSDSTLRDLGTQITNSCGSDLTNLGLPSSTVSQLPDLLPKYYPVGVEALCSREYVSFNHSTFDFSFYLDFSLSFVRSAPRSQTRSA